jgi:hypothetical protein
MWRQQGHFAKSRNLAFLVLAHCIPLSAVCQWWSFLPIFAFIDILYGLMGGSVKWLIVWGVTAP